MTPRRRRMARLLAAVLAVAALGLAWPATSARAEAPDALGWWSKLKPTNLPPELGNPVPPPPDAPNEGFLVANDPAGPQALAAMRFEATRPRKATLTIRTPEGETLSPGVELAVCPVLGEWDQTIDGAWDTRPEPDCLTIVSPGTINDDRTEVAFAVNEEFFRLGVLVNTIEVYVVPAPDTVAPFRAAFARPDGTTLVADGPLLEAPTLEPAYEPPPEPTYEPPPVTFAPLPSAGAGDETFEPLPPTNADGEVAVDDPTFTIPPRAGPIAGLPASGGSGDRVLAVALLAALAAGLFVVSGQSLPAPRLLGGLASEGQAEAAAPLIETGIGRFRKPRAGAPPTMR